MTSILGRDVARDRFGDGPPVVFCHGTPWSSALWRPIAEALSSEYTVHLWDMPGYGRSSKRPGDPVDIGVQAQILAELLDEWGLDRPHVIAHDLGGAVSLRARLRHGARYASLCLVDVVALSPWGSPFFRLVGEHEEVFAQLPAAIHRAVVERYVAGASHRELGADDLAMLCEPWLGDEGQAAFYRQMAQADERFTDDIEPDYPTIDEPTHVIWGAEDAWIPRDRANRLGELIPAATVTVLPGAGHLVQLDAPVALTAELVRWLGCAGTPAV